MQGFRGRHRGAATPPSGFAPREQRKGVLERDEATGWMFGSERPGTDQPDRRRYAYSTGGADVSLLQGAAAENGTEGRTPTGRPIRSIGSVWLGV
jgi:hypothetical protein